MTFSVDLTSDQDDLRAPSEKVNALVWLTVMMVMADFSQTRTLKVLACPMAGVESDS